MQFSEHKNALWVLIAVSFAESSFFLIPPDPLLIPMCITKRHKAWFYATACTIASVLGGFLGYYIGYKLFKYIGHHIIEFYGLEEKFQTFRQGFAENAFLIISLKALTPIPYKIVTITSGVAKISLPIFTIASLIARGSRFFMLAGLCVRFGGEIHNYINKHVSLVMWSALVIMILVLYSVKFI